MFPISPKAHMFFKGVFTFHLKLKTSILLFVSCELIFTMPKRIRTYVTAFLSGVIIQLLSHYSKHHYIYFLKTSVGELLTLTVQNSVWYKCWSRVINEHMWSDPAFAFTVTILASAGAYRVCMCSGEKLSRYNELSSLGDSLLWLIRDM